MNVEEEHIISCPYCGESISVLIDCTQNKQEYLEDCQVCCKPIIFHVQYDDDHSIQVNVQHENE
jgi:hypothetical protein